MADEKKPGPWWRNTYFIFGFILAIIGIIGLVKGPNSIADPGQYPTTSSLPWLYLLAAAVFVCNGFLSHKVHEREQRNQGDS